MTLTMGTLLVAAIAGLLLWRYRSVVSLNKTLVANVAERARAEERFRAIFAQQHQLAGIVSTDGILVDVNEKALALSGLERESVLNRSYWDTPWWNHCPELQARVRSACSAAARGELVQFEATHPRPDGSMAIVDFSLRPVNGNNGTTVFLVAESQDITERKTAERQLTESHDLLERRVEERTAALAHRNEQLRSEKTLSENLIKTAQAIIVLLDREGRITLFNPFLEALTGYKAEEVLRKDWFTTFIPENDRAELRLYFDTVMREGINRGYVNPILTKGGQLREIEWYGKTLEDADGHIVGLLNTGHDITEQRKVAKALTLAKQEAERANVSKSRFLAAASHDLRQPLQTLSLLNGVLERTATDDATGRIVAQQRESLAAVDSMLSTLLDINKLEAGAVTPEVTAFAVDSLLTAMSSEFAHLAQAKGLTLRVMACSATVRSDPDLTRVILRNLIANAVKYTQRGKVVVGCRRRGQILRIEVWDTGPGIPDDRREQIFEEFYQLGNPERDRQRGLGIGLAIVERLTRLLGHRIELQSAVGRGTMFAVLVPRVVQVMSHGAREADVSEPVMRSNGSSARILFIEDDPTILTAVTLLLEAEGFTVYGAATGAAALARVADGEPRPDLVISDYRLPGGTTGCEVIEQLRATLGAHFPAVVMTGETGKAQVEEAARLGLEILHKPVRGDKLIETIRTLLA